VENGGVDGGGRPPRPPFGGGWGMGRPAGPRPCFTVHVSPTSGENGSGLNPKGGFAPKGLHLRSGRGGSGISQPLARGFRCGRGVISYARVVSGPPFLAPWEENPNPLESKNTFGKRGARGGRAEKPS